MTVSVSNGNECLEAGTLTGRTLLLNRHDLHDLILKLTAKEVIDDLGLLDGDGVKEDLLKTADLSIGYETSKLGDRSPLLGLTRLSRGTTTAAAASTTTSTESTTGGSCFFRHFS
jgi:hypothetical protein